MNHIIILYYVVLIQDGIMQDDPPVVMLVQEEVPIGTEIGRLRAIDEDIEENAAIDYAIICTLTLLLFY